MVAIVDAENRHTDKFCKLCEFGKYQAIQYFLICLPIILVAMLNVNYVFVAENVDFRCRVPECDGPDAAVTKPAWWQADDTKCIRPVFNVTENETCSKQIFNDLRICDEWIYEHNNSAISELNIGCQAWTASLVGTIHNIGMLFSMIFMGWMADRFGRKPTIIVCVVGGAVGIFKIFVSNFYVYLGIECLESFIASGLFTVAVVWMIEIGGETRIMLVGVTFSYATYVGEGGFAFIAMGLKYWKSVILATYGPMVFFIMYIFIMQESTRWQLVRGKITDAKKVLKVIAKVNKLPITSEEIDNANEDHLRLKLNIACQTEKETVMDIIRSKTIMIRLTVISFCFFSCTFVYYGLAVQAVYLPGDKYLNFAWTAVISFPGDLLAFYTSSKYGRKITLQAGYISCCIFLLAQAFTPDSLPWLKLLLFLLGKLGIAVCFTAIYTYSLELFPTSVRGSLMGFCSTIARIGGVLTTLTPLLVNEFSGLPSILFASTAFVAALLLVIVPETKNLPLFDTVQQVEACQ